MVEDSSASTIELHLQLLPPSPSWSSCNCDQMPWMKLLFYHIILTVSIAQFLILLIYGLMYVFIDVWIHVVHCPEPYI